MFKKITTFTLTIIVPIFAWSGDISLGKSKSATCIACHGPGGISLNTLWPNLAGQQKAYLEKQLKAFKDGTRKDPIMSPMAQILSAEDIKNVSAYFNSLPASNASK